MAYPSEDNAEYETLKRALMDREAEFDGDYVGPVPESLRTRKAEVEIARLETLIKILQLQLGAMRRSLSWRIVEPLRALSSRFRATRQFFFHFAQTLVGKQFSAPRAGKRGVLEVLRASGFFAEEWYWEENPDVEKAGYDPIDHYVSHGASEMRDPNPFFDTSWYLEKYPDVQSSGINPLFHYIEHGAEEGRFPHPAFKSDYLALGPQDLRGLLKRAAVGYPSSVNGRFLLPRILRPPQEQLRLRVLLIANLGLAQCSRYRVWQKKRLFASLGVPCTVLEWTEVKFILNALQTHSLVIFYRVPGFQSQLELIAEAKRLKIPVLWEADDLIFDLEAYKSNQNLQTLDDALRASVLEGVPLFKKALEAAGVGIASTEKLALAMERFGVRAFVIENCLDEDIIKVGDTNAEKAKPYLENGIKIFYGSGSKAHDVDFQCAAGGIVRMMQHSPNTRLRIMGDLILTKEFIKFKDRIERVPFCDYQTYLDELAGADINIAPLEKNEFNDSKSNIKFLEAGVLGIPTVASPSQSYSKVISSGQNGILAQTSDEWFKALKDLADSLELRNRIGRAAREYVLRKYQLNRIAEEQLRPVIHQLYPGAID